MIFLFQLCTNLFVGVKCYVEIESTGGEFVSAMKAYAFASKV